MNLITVKSRLKSTAQLSIVPKVSKKDITGQMSVNQFLKTLNKENKGYRDLRKVFKTWEGMVVSIYKKDYTLPGNIMGRLSSECLPIVDKKLQVVIELKEKHELFLRFLFVYHLAEEWGCPWKPAPDQHALLYLDMGYGYYFDYVRGGIRSMKINEREYLPDRFDKDLFAELENLPRTIVFATFP